MPVVVGPYLQVSTLYLKDFIVIFFEVPIPFDLRLS